MAGQPRGWWIFFLILTALGGLVVWEGAGLPSQVASHFGPGGAPDGYSSRAVYRSLMLALVWLGPLLMAGGSALVLGRPGIPIHIPRGDYWLAAPRRSATLAYLTAHMQAAALFLAGFLAYANHLVVTAQGRQPVALDNASLFLGVGLFFGALLVLFGTLNRHFRRVPGDA
ncbi:DUF1648 domain-containing protein [Azospira inquinata]|uniref:DUF1648 domain-containing protein n=1 Tax=Azospira inquinata TaxID=2785627 RepID=UPI001C0CC084|nr:DUF1648 domain-containing protein [Azospira inquinata]QWT46375.1 DUF1648 domain-containing protein [Azospira inquinata]